MACENQLACWCATVEAETDRARRVAAGKIRGVMLGSVDGVAGTKC